MVNDLSNQPHEPAVVRRRISGWTIAAISLTAFLLGAAATLYAVRNYGRILPLPIAKEAILGDAEPAVTGPEPSPAISTSDARDVAAAAEAVEEASRQQGGLDQRVAALEQRLTRLDLQAQAASGNTARAEGLLIAFATRRALERGAPLGYLADQLRLRFGNAQPNAVRTIIESSRQPITLDQLVARLEGLSQELITKPRDEGVWDWMMRELDGLFVVRRESAPSPAPRMRLERAQMFLESGRIAAAMDEVRNMPGAADATAWIADAERYARTQEALQLIETTAVLEPRQLRDSSGQMVEQPSPAEG